MSCNLPWKRTFPHWYHKNVCRILGIRVHITGYIDPKKPSFLIANHASWLDITTLSAVAPVSFIAKKEVASWPFFSWLAKLQRSIFIDRTRRTSTKHSTNEILERLQQGDNVVLFAEGTSSDGNQVLPFKTALFATVENCNANEIAIQTLTVAYTSKNGIPLGRAGRPHVAWYGDMGMIGHLWSVFCGGPLDIKVHISPPIEANLCKKRKELAHHAELAVRSNLAKLLIGKPL
ncbi:MAG: lysophospholipid acyltransferase family protein [Pseudomonadota bacterium]